MTAITLDQAYKYCLNKAQTHYENFPVASFVLPKAIRGPVSVIYTFSRQADDFADEGQCPDDERLSLLERYADLLRQIERGETPIEPLFVALQDVIQRFDLPYTLFHDLLTAFKMDVSKKRYANDDEILGYCRYSANPVGRLLLHLSGNATPQNLTDSDAICSALQLINFLQDMQQDYVEMDRIYMPQDAMARYSVTEAHFRDNLSDDAMRALFRERLDYAEQLIYSGAALGWRLNGRFGLEIRLITASGLQTLALLKNLDKNVFARPRLRKRDYLYILMRAFIRAAPGSSTPVGEDRNVS